MVLAAWIVWLLTADLTATEQQTLNGSSILNLAGQHLVLTLQATLLVLVIGIPLGILLTVGRSVAPAPRSSPSRTSARPHPRWGSSSCSPPGSG